MIYLIKFHTGAIGQADNWHNALVEAIGLDATRSFINASGPKGYLWSQYQTKYATAPKQIKRVAPVGFKQEAYEYATIADKKGNQVCQVYRSESSAAIKALMKRLQPLQKK